jgi:hypothetical protein
VEEERRKREERAAKFGVATADADLEKQKKLERLARFKTEASVNVDEQKAKIAERKARFGNAEGKVNTGKEVVEQIKKGTLQFTLDDYRVKH